jgi:hypothetical protein
VLAAAVLAGTALVAYATLVEPRRLRVRRRTLRLERWPAAFDGLRVALVADLHAGAPHMTLARLDRVVARTNAAGADLVALLGDQVDREVVLGRTPDPGAVAARLAGLRAPLGVLAVLGNHDWRTDGPGIAAALGDRGIRVLEDEAVRLAHAPVELWVAGLADATERSPDVARALRAVPADAAVLVLSHDPDLFPRIPERVALTVAGHVHGGQVDLPVLRRLWIPSRYGDRYRHGHVVEGGRHLYVTAGVGTSGLPVRLGVPPEVVVLTLRTRSGSRRRAGARRRAR